jgi:hypothetical protein
MPLGTIGNSIVNNKLNLLIEESASFVRRYVEELAGHKVRQRALDTIAEGVEGFKSPGDVYRPFSKFAPLEPIASASAMANAQSSELLIKGRQ